MEPNVDRGMWSVVALLAAIVIGGVVLLAFPRITGKIANGMNDMIDDPHAAIKRMKYDEDLQKLSDLPNYDEISANDLIKESKLKAANSDEYFEFTASPSKQYPNLKDMEYAISTLENIEGNSVYIKDLDVRKMY